ncbi:hypothetical protein V1478_014339 [Vespula squamosa]|uniref:Uncharacterized protein n=1 Tax=Vespula squamosa TaxID=30214 RepID=A0ABD2A7S3_VESSQ
MQMPGSSLGKANSTFWNRGLMVKRGEKSPVGTTLGRKLAESFMGVPLGMTHVVVSPSLYFLLRFLRLLLFLLLFFLLYPGLARDLYSPFRGARVIEAHVGRTGIAGRFIASCRNCRERLVRINDTFIGPCYSTNCDVEKVLPIPLLVVTSRDPLVRAFTEDIEKTLTLLRSPYIYMCISGLSACLEQLVGALCARTDAPWRRLRDAVAVAVAVALALALALERVNVASREVFKS